MQIYETVPRYDLPVDFLVDDDIRSHILSLYKMFPCKIKAAVFAMCMSGEVKVTINLQEYTVKENDFVIIVPGSFFQIHSVEEDTRAAFCGFSSSFIGTAYFWKRITDNLSEALNHPVLPLEEYSGFFRNFFSFLTTTANTTPELLNKEFLSNIVDMMCNSLGPIYTKRFGNDQSTKPREYQVLAEFLKLAFENYPSEHKVSFYAGEAGLTLSHFCATIKRASGTTAQDILKNLIIMDAKAQLKSSDTRINLIAKSLGFSPTAFNRYFMEYVQMTPLEYRNS